MAKEYKKYNFDEEFRNKNYPESSWPLLNDYLSRCANEFDLSEKELKQKLNVLLNNLDTIEIDNNPDSLTNACYYSKEKKISLNYAGMSARNESYLAHLCSMFHELNHACENMNSRESTSFMKRDARTGRYRWTSINEVLTEMKAARLTMNLRLSADMGPGSDPKCLMRHSGYNDLMFVGTMMQTALGVSEQEFLAAADKGPEYFKKVMSKKFPDEADYDRFMARVGFCADSIHAIKFADTDAPLSRQEMNNITTYTADLYKECLAAMNMRMATEMARGDIDPETFSQKSRYEIDRLTTNYHHAISINTPYKPEYLIPPEQLGDTQSKVLAIEAVNANAKKLGKKNVELLLNALTNLDNDPSELLAKYGIDLPSTEGFNDVDFSQYKRDFLIADYGEGQWDNHDCMGAIKNMETALQSDGQQKTAKVIEFRPKFISDLSKKVASSDSRNFEAQETYNPNSIDDREAQKEQEPEL